MELKFDVFRCVWCDDLFMKLDIDSTDKLLITTVCEIS